MSPETMNYIYYICIGLFGLVMYKTPQTFMGRAKYDEGTLKAQNIIKKSGLALLIFCAAISAYTLFFK